MSGICEQAPPSPSEGHLHSAPSELQRDRRRSTISHPPPRVAFGLPCPGPSLARGGQCHPKSQREHAQQPLVTGGTHIIHRCLLHRPIVDSSITMCAAMHGLLCVIATLAAASHAQRS